MTEMQMRPGQPDEREQLARLLYAILSARQSAQELDHPYAGLRSIERAARLGDFGDPEVTPVVPGGMLP